MVSKRAMNKVTLVAALLLVMAPAAASSIAGRVVGVTDGDTLLVLTPSHEQVKIRLAQIDAPESKQAFGARSKQSLSGLCFNRQASVEVVDIDRYGRTVGTIRCDGIDANRAQVEAGMAWVYRRYAKDESLLQAEAAAQAGRIGLWADANPTPPWEWRKKNK